MSPERTGALAAALNARRVQRARLRAAFFNRWRATTLAAAVHATRRLLDPTPRPEPSPEAAVGALRRDLARLLVKDSALDESCIKAAAARASAKRRRRPLTPISPPPPPPSVQKENVSPGARRVKQLGRGIRRLYDAYATTHAKKLFPDAAVDLFRDCGVVPAHASADDIKAVVGTEPIDYDGSSAASTRLTSTWIDRGDAVPADAGNDSVHTGFCRAVAELGHVCFCRAVDVEGVGRVWTPARDDDPLRALFRVISSSKAFYAAQKHSAALW